MTELELYKFIHDNDIEYHWHYNEEIHEQDVLLFPSYYVRGKLFKLLEDSNILYDEGLKCVMKYDYFCLWVSDIFYNTKNIEAVFPRKEG